MTIPATPLESSSPDHISSLAFNYLPSSPSRSMVPRHKTADQHSKHSPIHQLSSPSKHLEGIQFHALTFPGGISNKRSFSKEETLDSSVPLNTPLEVKRLKPPRTRNGSPSRSISGSPYNSPPLTDIPRRATEQPDSCPHTPKSQESDDNEEKPIPQTPDFDEQVHHFQAGPVVEFPSSPTLQVISNRQHSVKRSSIISKHSHHDIKSYLQSTERRLDRIVDEIMEMKAELRQVQRLVDPELDIDQS